MKKTIFFSLLAGVFSCLQVQGIGYNAEDIRNAPLKVSSTEMSSNPILEVRNWQEDAEQMEGYQAAHVAVLSTANKEAVPSARAMCIKSISEEGFVFFGDLRSKKFQDLAVNPNAALTFNWMDAQRQITVSGKCYLLSEKEARDYFATRKKGAQAASIASEQDKPLASRGELQDKHQNVLDRNKDKEIQAPAYWGGYRLVPDVIEFWQAGPDNLHERVMYTKVNGQWKKTLLNP